MALVPILLHPKVGKEGGRRGRKRGKGEGERRSGEERKDWGRDTGPAFLMLSGPAAEPLWQELLHPSGTVGQSFFLLFLSELYLNWERKSEVLTAERGGHKEKEQGK